jgi:hypothetical protein
MDLEDEPAVFYQKELKGNKRWGGSDISKKNLIF